MPRRPRRADERREGRIGRTASSGARRRVPARGACFASAHLLTPLPISPGPSSSSSPTSPSRVGRLQEGHAVRFSLAKGPRAFAPGWADDRARFPDVSPAFPPNSGPQAAAFEDIKRMRLGSLCLSQLAETADSRLNGEGGRRLELPGATGGLRRARRGGRGEGGRRRTRGGRRREDEGRERGRKRGGKGRDQVSAGVKDHRTRSDARSSCSRGTSRCRQRCA